MDGRNSADFYLLCKVIVQLESVDECKDFLYDLLSNTEIICLSQRIAVTDLLITKKSYRKIFNKTRASFSTISKVSYAVNYGNGSFIKLLDRMRGG